MKMLNETPAKLPPFTVTPDAIGQIALVGGIVSVDIIAGGCRGSTFQFLTGRGVGTAFGCPGAELVVSPAALEVLQGAKRDYSGRVKPPRFQVLANPNTPQRCPCNRSFGRPWPRRGCQQCQARPRCPGTTSEARGQSLNRHSTNSW